MKNVEIVPVHKMKKLKRTLKFCKSVGIDKIHFIPIRKNGMTGSGRPQDCHNNVDKLCLVYGGKTVRGYAISIFKECVMFFCHSIWETPEGNWVDITYNNSKIDRFRFAPLKSFDSTEGYESGYDFIFFNDIHRGVAIIDSFNGKVIKKYPQNIFKFVNWTELCIPHKFTNKERIELFQKSGIEDTFSNPSSATGKNFFQIWEERNPLEKLAS